jgi:hypothetical protein
VSTLHEQIPLTVQQAKEIDMTKTQVTQTRAAINAAHQCGDLAEAEKLQAKLHAYFEQQSSAFMSSADGVRHMASLVNKFD